MMKVRQACAAALMLGVAVTTGTVRAADEAVPEEIIISAKADFQTYCAACHGPTGVGDGPVAKDLVTAPSDLTQLAKTNGGTFPEDRVHRVIDGREEVGGHGSRDMPIWGSWFKFVARSGGLEDVDEETTEVIVSLRIQGMIEYLKSIQAQ